MSLVQYGMIRDVINLLNVAWTAVSAFIGMNKIYVYLAAGAVALGGAGYLGYQLGGSACDKEQKELLEQTIAYYERVIHENERINEELTEELYAARRSTRITAEEVTRYVESHPNLNVWCQLDAAGLRLWNGEDPN